MSVRQIMKVASSSSTVSEYGNWFCFCRRTSAKRNLQTGGYVTESLETNIIASLSPKIWWAFVSSANNCFYFQTTVSYLSTFLADFSSKNTWQQFSKVIIDIASCLLKCKMCETKCFTKRIAPYGIQSMIFKRLYYVFARKMMYQCSVMEA